MLSYFTRTKAMLFSRINFKEKNILPSNIFIIKNVILSQCENIDYILYNSVFPHTENIYMRQCYPDSSKVFWRFNPYTKFYCEDTGLTEIQKNYSNNLLNIKYLSKNDINICILNHIVNV